MFKIVFAVRSSVPSIRIYFVNSVYNYLWKSHQARMPSGQRVQHFNSNGNEGGRGGGGRMAYRDVYS